MFLPAPSSLAASAAAGAAPTSESWAVVCAWLREQVTAMSLDLNRAHQILLERARREAPELVDRLLPPTPTRAGYGILPDLLEDVPLSELTPNEHRYSLEELSRSYPTILRDARLLIDHTLAQPDADLEPAVATYVRLQKAMKLLESRLAYQEWWQEAVADNPAYFDARNLIISNVERLLMLVKQDGSSPAATALRDSIRAEIAPFTPVAGLSIKTRSDGSRVLDVRAFTDIDDPGFLREFEEAVELAWNQTSAARERQFSIQLKLIRTSVNELYPENPPQPGDGIDVKSHVTRFPAGAMVLTTGATSTHSWTGRSILLGPSPISRRALAHEFGHLLGFNDGYLRGYEGEFGAPFGVVLVEWWGLADDLMGNSRGGRVTAAMIGQLLTAYGE